MDAALEKCVKLESAQRYETLSEFIQDLRHPNPQLNSHLVTSPLLARNHIAF